MYQQYSTRKYYLVQVLAVHTPEMLPALEVLQLLICGSFQQINGDEIIEPVYNWSNYTSHSEYTAHNRVLAVRTDEMRPVRAVASVKNPEILEGHGVCTVSNPEILRVQEYPQY